MYFSRNRDYGGIDGVSYSGVAYALSEKGFFSLEGLSGIFNKVELSFIQENGDVSVVVPIDKLSIVVTVIFSYFVFKERLSKKAFCGLCLMVAGTLLMVFCG